MGDGRNISVYDDKWIPSPARFRVRSPFTLDPHATVKELILNTGEWNAPLTNASFLPFEAEKILSLARPRRAQNDTVIWHFDKQGVYTVRSGYHKARKLAAPRDAAGLSRNQLETLWPKIWSLQIPPKIKIFIWCACQDIIPTRGNLAHRHIPVSGDCQFCDAKWESTPHALIFCPLVEVAWTRSPFEHIRESNPHKHLRDILYEAAATLSDEDASLLATLLWEVWNQRNKQTHEGRHDLMYAFQRASMIHKDFVLFNKQTSPINRDTA